MTHAVDFGACFFAGDPDVFFAARFWESELAVESERGFQGDKRFVSGDPAGEGFVELLRFGFEQTGFDFDSCGAQAGKSGATRFRIGILDGGDYARDASRENRFGARARASCVIAGLQSHIESGTASAVAGLFQRNDFTMVALVILMKPFAKDCAVLDDDATHCGIRAGEADAFARQVQRVLHEVEVVRVRHGGWTYNRRTRRDRSKRDPSTA